MTVSRRAAVALALVLILAPIVGAASVAGTTAPGAMPQSVQDNATNEYGYTLSELESSGDVRESDKPSLRVLGTMQYLWALDYEVGLKEDYGKESSEQWLEPGATINRNQFELRGNFPYDGETREYDLEVVYYTPDTRRTQTENGTTTERYANISAVDTQRVTFDPGISSTANVSLRPHYDQATQVSVFLVDDDGDTVAKWGPYTHTSVQTTASVPFSTYGGLVPWLIKWFVLATGVGAAFAVGGGYTIAKGTGGFGKGLLWWALVTGISGGIAIFTWYAEIVAWIVALPFLLALPVVFGVFIVTVEVMQPAFRARLENPTISETESAVGGDQTRAHIEGEHADDIYAFERDEGLGFIKYGSIRAALARRFAGLAIVPWDRIKKRYKSAGTAPESEKFYITDYEFTPAHWTYSFPDLVETTVDDDGERHREIRTDIIIGGAGLIVFGSLVGGGVFNAPLLGAAAGLLPVLAMGLDPKPGDIDIEFASGAAISAKGARLTETEEKLKWESIDDAIEDIGNARTDVWKKVQRIVQKQREERDKTAEEMYDLADGTTPDGSTPDGSKPGEGEAVVSDD